MAPQWRANPLLLLDARVGFVRVAAKLQERSLGNALRIPSPYLAYEQPRMVMLILRADVNPELRSCLGLPIAFFCESQRHHASRACPTFCG